MPFFLQAISPGDDADAIAYCNAGSFWADNHWRHQWGNTSRDQVIADTASRTPLSLITGRTEKRYLKAVDSESGKLVGYARWILPESLIGESCWKEALIPKPTVDQDTCWTAQSKTTQNENGKSRGLNYDMVRALGGAMAAVDSRTRRKYSEREFLELDYVAVHENWQGRGIGKMLVRRGIEIAAELRMNYIIMGFTNSGKRMYDRMAELIKEEEVVQSCKRWPVGRQPDCTCQANFYVWIYKEREVS